MKRLYKHIAMGGKGMWMAALLMAVLLTTWQASPTLAATTCTWTGSSNSDWHTATNWDCGIVPGSSDTVIVPDVTNDPVLAATSQVLNLEIQSGTVITINAGFELILTGGGTLTGGGDITGGVLTFGDGSYYSSYTVNYTGTIASANINVGQQLLLVQDLNVTDLTITQISSVGGDFDIRSTGTITTQDASFTHEFTTSGVKLVSTGDQTITGTGVLFNLEATNGGAVRIPNNLMLQGGGTLTGGGDITGGVLTFGDGSYYSSYTVNYTGTIASANINVGQQLLLVQDLNVTDLTITQISSVGGDFDIRSTGTITTQDASFTHEFTTSGVKLVSTGDQTITGTGVLFNLEATNGGAVRIPNNLMLQGGGTLTGGGDITGGVLTFGDGSYYSSYTVNYTGTIASANINVGQQLLLVQDLNVTDLTITQISSVGGDFDIRSTGTITTQDASFTHEFTTSGVKLVSTGDQTITGTGVLFNLEATNGGAVRIPNNLMLQGGGTLTGGGDITGGVLTFGDGSYYSSYTVNYTGTIASANINVGQQLLLVQDLNVTDLTITQISSVGGDFDIRSTGTITTQDASFTHEFTTSGVKLVSTGDQTITGTGVLFNLEATNGGAVRIPNNLMLQGGGTLTGGGDITGGVLTFGDGSYYSSYTVNYTGTIASANINVGQQLLLVQDLNVTDLTITQISSVGGDFDIRSTGTITTQDASFTHEFTTSGVKLVSTGDQTITGTGVLFNLDFAKPSGDVIFADGFDRSFTSVVVSAGEWDVLGNSVSATNGFTAQGGAITGAGTLTGTVTVGTDGTLGGTVTVNGNVTAHSGGTLGKNSSADQATINGNLLLNGGSTLNVDINGTTPGTEYDQWLVNGTVTINSATLTGTVTAWGSSTTLIVNDGSDPISGAGFAGASTEGSSVTVGDKAFEIFYQGESGNDLVLVSTDSDGDGVNDDVDNCPNSSNPDQADQDGDGIGDLCDPDRDGDNIENNVDNCPSVVNPDQADVDNDGIGDTCDPDKNGNGIPDIDEPIAADDTYTTTLRVFSVAAPGLLTQRQRRATAMCSQPALVTDPAVG